MDEVEKWAGRGGGRTEILRGVSFRLRAGEFVSIMGASGSGKSTLLQIMGLLDEPSRGSLWFYGKEMARAREDERAVLRARRIGFVFQSFNLLPYLTARENVAVPMGYARRADAAERSRRLLGQMKLSHRENAFPATLSGGERQRVAIARALANEPGLLLADEPTGALDSRSGAEILELLCGLNRQGVAIVLVTHDPAIARRAHRILQMKDGRLFQEGGG